MAAEHGVAVADFSRVPALGLVIPTYVAREAVLEAFTRAQL